MTAEEAVLARVTVEVGALRRLRRFWDGPAFEQLSEHVNRLLASIDAAVNGMGMLLDLQLNQRAYLVSVVATIFVPLTFLTGFCRMNFGWTVDHIGSPRYARFSSASRRRNSDSRTRRTCVACHAFWAST